MTDAHENPFRDSRAPSGIISIREFSDAVSVTSVASPQNVRNSTTKRFKSYRLVGAYEKPWINDPRLNRTRYSNMIVYGFMVLGFLASAFICFSKYRSVEKHTYCLILDEKFQNGINSDVWTQEVQVGGYGTGTFDWTTTDPTNAYTSPKGLHIVPTLTNETTTITQEQIMDGYTLNLTTDARPDGACTVRSITSCSVRSNATQGTTIPPVRSARLNTKGKKSIRYGRVEVVAKMPRGDWLWPAIWMMPEEDIYGPWPRSGEIDIAELRGNDRSYPNGGRDVYASTLHWGPSPKYDGYWRDIRGNKLLHTDYSTTYHIFGLVWSQNYLFTYLDSQLQSIVYIKFKGSSTLWQRGGFGGLSENENGTMYVDPWSGTGRTNTPFDASFYLILNVAVGSRNGWFEDGRGGKPWVDATGERAVGDFWRAVGKWLPTWGNGEERGMTVKRVRMWQEGACA